MNSKTNVEGCPFKEGGKGIECGKLSADDSRYCPKHVLVVQHESQRYKRLAAKSVIARQRKADLEEALKSSPLKAFNPEFDAVSRPGRLGVGR